jgi:hypothetical protein
LAIAAAVLTLRSPPSVVLEVHVPKLPDSNPSAKIESLTGVGVGVDVGVLVGAGVEVGVAVFVGVGDGPGVAVAVDVGVAVGVAVGEPDCSRRTIEATDGTP